MMRMMSASGPPRRLRNAAICPELGEQRKWLGRARNVAIDPTATFNMRSVQLSYGAFVDCPAQPRRLSWRRVPLLPSIVQASAALNQ